MSDPQVMRRGPRHARRRNGGRTWEEVWEAGVDEEFPRDGMDEVCHVQTWQGNKWAQVFFYETGMYGLGYGSGSRPCDGVHRVAWKLHTGQEIPLGFDINHVCYNAACYRPEHLELMASPLNQSEGRHVKALYKKIAFLEACLNG